MRNAILAGLILAGWFTKDPLPSERPPDPPPQSVRPSPSPTVGTLRTMTPPYEPGTIQEATKRLARFKGITREQYRAHPELLIADQEDLARFFGYMAVIALEEDHKSWAILYYCYAVKADPRFLTLVDLVADPDPSFSGTLSLIQLEAVKFLADQVAPESFNVQPSQLRHQKKEM